MTQKREYDNSFGPKVRLSTVGETYTRYVQLMRDRDGLGRTVAVLAEYRVGLTGPRVIAAIRVSVGQPSRSLDECRELRRIHAI